MEWIRTLSFDAGMASWERGWSPAGSSTQGNIFATSDRKICLSTFAAMVSSLNSFRIWDQTSFRESNTLTSRGCNRCACCIYVEGKCRGQYIGLVLLPPDQEYSVWLVHGLQEIAQQAHYVGCPSQREEKLYGTTQWSWHPPSTLSLTLSTVYPGGHLQCEQSSSSFLCIQCTGVASHQLMIYMPGLCFLCHYFPLSHAHFSLLFWLKSSGMQLLCISQSHQSSTGVSLFHCKTFHSTSASQIAPIYGN